MLHSLAEDKVGLLTTRRDAERREGKYGQGL